MTLRSADTVVVTTGAWKDTVGVIESINEERQTLTIRVELFGRETPVELELHRDQEDDVKRFIY